nr:hypothetical protein [Tanacetum cinerariifolium]
MSVDVARSHGSDGGGVDYSPPQNVPTCKGKQKPNLVCRTADRLHTRDKTRNLLLKEIMDKKGPVLIRFDVRDKQTLMPLGDHAAHWSSYIGEVIMGVPLYYPSWLKVSKARKASLNTNIETQFDLRPHMESPDWTEIDVGIQQQLQKVHIPMVLPWKSGISICHTPDKAWTEYVFGGVTLLRISRIQQYLQNEHFALWEVIKFSDSYQAPPEETSKGSLRFSKYESVQELWGATLKTFGGNEATKITKKNQLKQQYGNFKAEGLETLEQTFNRLQAIMSHLEFMDVENKMI